MKTNEFQFEKLHVYAMARELVKEVYFLQKSFPSDERYALSSQVRRSITSVVANIAEGNGRASNKDYAHFLAIARGSLYETITQIQIAEDLGYIDKHDNLDQLAADVGRMLTSLLKKYGAIHSTPTPTSPLYP